MMRQLREDFDDTFDDETWEWIYSYNSWGDYRRHVMSGYDYPAFIAWSNTVGGKKPAAE